MPKRRANGEGNIRKRKDGRWEGRCTVGHDPETGKAIIKNVLGKTQTEVKEKLKKAIEENVGIDYGRAKTYTVGSWLEVWMENYAKIKLRPSTYKTSQGFLKNHIKPQIGSIPLADLTSLDLQRFYKHLLDGGRVDRIEAKKKPKGLAPKTVRNIHQMIGSAYNLAMEQKLVSKNPTQGCALPKVEHKEMKTLTSDQLSTFFQEAKDSGVYELYYLDLATGLRRGELLGLKWMDVDFQHGALKIQRAISRQNGKVVEAPLKTKNAYRTLPLSADAISVLKMQKCKVGNSEWVFPSPTGGPMSPDSVLHMLQRVLKRAGLPRIRFHDLRHTFATMALQNGVDVKTVSSMLGHYSAGFTLDTYAHVTTDAQLKAAQTIMPKRRANGEGNIRKRKDGRWEGRYTVGHDPETGKAIIKNVLGKTQAEVKEKLKKAIEENVGIDYGRAKNYTVGNWLEVWYENYAKIKMRPSTYLTYHGYIENHIKPQLGKISLNDLTTLHLQQFYKELLAEGRVERIEAQKQPKGLSAKTVRNIHQIISSALKLAVEQRLIAHNPADGCALPKAERKEMQTLPVEQLTSFLREAKDSGVFALYYIDLITGLRRGELLGLKWSDIDLEKGDLRVQRQIGRIDGKIIEMPLKTKNAYRTLPLSADAINVLKIQKCKVGNSEWVFPSPTGGPMSPDSVLHMLHRVLKRAGLPRIRFHDLRHTFATLALQNGVDVKTVSGMLGHFSAGFTLDTYAHVTTSAKREAAKTMGNILSGAV